MRRPVLFLEQDERFGEFVFRSVYGPPADLVERTVRGRGRVQERVRVAEPNLQFPLSRQSSFIVTPLFGTPKALPLQAKSERYGILIAEWTQSDNGVGGRGRTGSK